MPSTRREIFKLGALAAAAAVLPSAAAAEAPPPERATPKVDSSFTVSVWPCGHAAASLASDIVRKKTLTRRRQSRH